MRFIIANIFLLSILYPVHAKTIHVPKDQPTIQAGIDAAINGDAVVLADGVHKGPGNRNILFKGKEILVRSASNAPSCIINCENLGRGFLFIQNENRNSELRGVTIINAEFGNGNGEHGQGIQIENSSPVIRDCEIRNCGYFYSGVFGIGPYGGGVSIKSGSPLIHGCLIEGNQAEFGGGIYMADSSAQIVACVILKNDASAWIDSGIPVSHYEGDGGGMKLYNCNNFLIQDCLVCKNSSKNEFGAFTGGISLSQSTGKINSSTIFAHSPGMYGLVLMDYCTIEMKQNIVYASNSGAIIHLFKSALNASYSDIKGGFPGIGNINQTPQFMDTNNENYRLKSISPCIDAGDPTFTPTNYFQDLDRNSRLLDGDLNHTPVVDMGPYEFSNIRMSILGDPLPGAVIQLRIRGEDGMYYAVFGGFGALNPPPLISSFGYLLIHLAAWLPPVVPLSVIPDDVYLTIPNSTPPGAWIHLLPICQDKTTYAGNFGAYRTLTIK